MQQVYLGVLGVRKNDDPNASLVTGSVHDVFRKRGRRSKEEAAVPDGRAS